MFFTEPLFSGLPNTVGALFPAVVSLGLVLAGRVRSELTSATTTLLIGASLLVAALLARSTSTSDENSLYIIPVAAFLMFYTIWRGYYVSMGFAFVMTYATLLPVDVFVAYQTFGNDFAIEAIGGAGWRDGLLVFPTLTALVVLYANWRRGQHNVRIMAKLS